MAAKKRTPKGGDLQDTTSNKKGGDEPAVNYAVIAGKNFAILSESVGLAMKDGWRCQGGVFAMSPACYLQAMVK
jgi:hypothetical protein